MSAYREIDRFVSENKELIERIMKFQKEEADYLADAGRDAMSAAFKSTAVIADYMKQTSEGIIHSMIGMMADREVQGHFIAAGEEFISGLNALVDAAPVPTSMRCAVSDFEKGMREAACRANKDCPAKRSRGSRVAIESKPECAE